MRVLSTRAIVIATGGRPAIPGIPGIEDVGYVTSDTVWELRTLPRRLLVLGGGPIGCELAQCFARLGAQVTRCSADHSCCLRKTRRSRRWSCSDCAPRASTCARSTPRCTSSATATRERWSASTPAARCASGSTSCSLRSDARRTSRASASRPSHRRQEGRHRRHQRVPRDDLPEHLRRRRCHRAFPVHPHGQPPGLVRRGERAVRTLPQVQGGLLGDPLVHLHRPRGRARRSQRARRQGQGHRLRGHHLRPGRPGPRDRRRGGARRGEGPDRPGKDRILGVTIVGEHAGELITEFIVAMRHGLGLNKILAPSTSIRRCPRPASNAAGAGSGPTRRSGCSSGWAAITPGDAADPQDASASVSRHPLPRRSRRRRRDAWRRSGRCASRATR